MRGTCRTSPALVPRPDDEHRCRLIPALTQPIGWKDAQRAPEWKKVAGSCVASIGVAAAIGHNNGPPIEDEPNDAFVRYRWKKAHAEAWKNPSLSILRFRVARAEAAGVTYHAYMLELLDTGRHLQAGDTSTGSSIPASSPGEEPAPVMLETPQPKD